MPEAMTHRFKVVIRSTKDNAVVATTGTNLSEAQAEKRLETTLSRINDEYYVDILPQD